MKAQEHSWEEDIRRQIEQHEFDFDSNAWEEMEALLDNAVLPPPDPRLSSARRHWWFYGKWGLPVLILLIGLWWLVQKQAPEIDLGGFTMTVPKPKEQPSEKVLTPELVIQEVTPRVVTRPYSQTTKVVVREKPDTVGNLSENPETIEKWPPIEKLPLVLPLLQHKVDTGSQINLFKQLKQPSLSPSKRKRNRRKLFPDVIDNY